MRSFPITASAIITVIVTRVYLALMWRTPFLQEQKADSWHHLYTGVIILLLSFPAPKRYAMIIRGIGLGLIVDECIHLLHLLGLITPIDYWDPRTIACTLLGLLVIWVTESRTSGAKIVSL